VRKYDESIPEVLIGDPVRLHQVILNLVSNAIKFTSKGKITVAVEKKEEDERKVTLEFSVTDTGIGIAEHKIGSIFDKFQQASSGTARLYGGTGLGLAIAKQLIVAQGGQIWVKSRLGEGSTFAFTLSFRKTKESLSPEKDQNVSVETTGNDHGRILVAEDVTLNQLLMKTLLDDAGYEVDIASNGRIAVDKLRENTYNVVLMDLQMPVMNGYEATEEIRNVLKLDVPIIALTADVTTADVEKCRAIGMNDYISKPVDEKVLYKKLAQYISDGSAAPKKEKKEKAGRASSGNITNLDFLKQLTKNDSDMIAEMIRVYLNETPILLERMRKGLQEKQWEELRAAAHSLVPSFSTMGFSEVYEKKARQLQQIAAESRNEEEASALVAELEDVCNRAFEELKREMTMLEKL
jgi:CheY-like chemotaxis protein/HPt (histidine-containing phosphotransfer) domain-containing protein